MIDIKLIRENPQLVRDNQKNRGYDEKVVDEILNLDKKWREFKVEDDALRADRNKISEEINKAKKQGKKIDNLLKQAKEIPLKLQENEAKENELKKNLDMLISLLPNIQQKGNPV